MGQSRLVSTRNELDQDVGDFVDFVVADDATSVVAPYLEGCEGWRGPARFRTAARMACRRRQAERRLRDRALGTAILPGTGGVTAELLNDTVLRTRPEHAPLPRGDELGMMRALRTWQRLDGYRGHPTADVDALADATCRIFTARVAVRAATGRGVSQSAGHTQRADGGPRRHARATPENGPAGRRDALARRPGNASCSPNADRDPIDIRTST
ncbi:acetate--CoA ligase family protein [Burkholderia multivorans]|uniref:acetate--CoA ligase family protein n=1 Tax=Burkholderia multivorans TaxID=87883 RepID=UPI00345EA160